MPTTTFTTPTSGQLGYTIQGTKTTAGIPFTYSTPSSTFALASLNLPYGVWNIIGQFSYFVNSAGQMPLVEQYSISKFPAGSLGYIDYECWELIQQNHSITGYMYPKRMNRIITCTSASTNLYLNLQLSFSVSGSYQITTDTQTNYTWFYAVRIA